MALDGIAARQRDVVAALHHARATAFTEQSLDCDRHLQRRIGLLGVKCGKQPCAARSQYQDVGLVIFHLHVQSTPRTKTTPMASEATPPHPIQDSRASRVELHGSSSSASSRMPKDM